MSGPNRVKELAEWLEGRGVAADGVRALETELDALERPAGLWSRMKKGALGLARRQWAHILGELEESKEVLALVRRAQAGESLQPAEQELVRGQLFDMLRVAPAGLMVVALQVFPIPGTGLLAPWVLMRLGLMPSRWREAHLLDQLRKESERLRAAHLDEEADAIDALERSLTEEGEARERRASEATLLAWWDADGDGQWSAEERAAYDAALDELAAGLSHSRQQRRWFLAWRHHVFGPARLDDLQEQRPDGELLVSLDGSRQWVRLSDLLERDTPS